MFELPADAILLAGGRGELPVGGRERTRPFSFVDLTSDPAALQGLLLWRTLRLALNHDVMNGRMATHSSAPRTSNATSQTPTKARYWVIVFAVTLAVLSYIDRVAI